MPGNVYKFSELIQNAYQDVSNILKDESEASGYKGQSYNQCINMLGQDTLLSAATQFHILFPAHFYKSMYVIENVLKKKVISGWLEHNPRICLVDIGCGAGAASAAFIDTIHTMLVEGALVNDLNICCIGVDVNPNALALYGTFIEQMRKNLNTSQLTLETHLIGEGLPHIETIVETLETKRNEWQQPRISHMLVMQMNVVHPLSGLYYGKQKGQAVLKRFGLSLSEGETNFGRREARAYNQLLSESKIDYMHVITIGTDNNDEEKYPLSDRVKEMSEAIAQHMEHTGHAQQIIKTEEHEVNYENPIGSFFRDIKRNVNYTARFYASINFVTNKDLLDDKRWQDILSIENLQLAWVRARQNLMRESLYDETELRLFEQDLEANLARLSRQLATYMEFIIKDEKISYNTPKSSKKSRPRGLTRLEEEIIAAAAIQDISKELSARYPRSYAYRINSPRGRGNEYLYQNWFDLYREYLREARETAIKYENTAIVIQTDIKGFYEKIIQARLMEIANDQFYRFSERVEWLLKKLVIHPQKDHDEGKGLTQGSIGSGFFSNVYLTSLDSLFEDTDIKLFRYVDDMILIIPNPSNRDEVMELLDSQLENLKLERSHEKTREFESVEEFLQTTNQNDVLNQLHEEQEDLLTFLWIGNDEFRTSLQFASHYNDEEWWHLLRKYQKCLAMLSIFFPLEVMSRKISQYLFNNKKRNEHLNGRHEIIFPPFPETESDSDYSKWFTEFQQKNQPYLNQVNNQRQHLLEVFSEVYDVVDWNDIKKEHRQIIRFVVNRLSSLGLNPISNQLIYMFTEVSWVLESYTLEYMALNRLYGELLEILDYHHNNTEGVAHEYMMAMILKAMRFLPELPEYVWEILFQYSVEPASIVERIMATETILFCRYSYSTPIAQKHLDTIKEALSGNGFMNNRLKKNYILILGKDLPVDYSLESKDSLLKEAQNIAQSPHIADIFDYVEPSIIRKKYYNSPYQQGHGY